MIRRGFLFGGATALLAAPAIVRVASLMQLSVLPEPVAAHPYWEINVLVNSGRLLRFKVQILRHAVPLEILGRQRAGLRVADYLTNESKGWING